MGENPEAARAAGLPVVRLQYTALALGGALAGVGGRYLSMGSHSLFQADMTGGRGFLALAAVFLGVRRPRGLAWPAPSALGGHTRAFVITDVSSAIRTHRHHVPT